jgi:cysteine desulfurase family protein (TIGR01976 family)
MFPALERPGASIFFDNAAGAQIPQRVIDIVSSHLLHRSVQRGGRYRESQEVDAAIDRAREAVAILVNARDPREIAFGMNATSFIRLVSLAIAQGFADRREIVVSDLDHEANIAAWLALEREGATIRWWKVREDGLLHAADLKPLLSSCTRLVACTVTSNAIGSVVDVAEAGRMAHAAGAEVLLDCVHYGPHGPIDVQAWNCDYLVCSGYKIFAPHMGFLWGRHEALNSLRTYREEFIPDVAPAKIEVGTFVYENVAAMGGAVEYLEQLGDSNSGTRRQRLVRAMERIRDYEMTLSAALLQGLRAIKGVVIYGLQDAAALHERVPTVAFNLDRVSPATVATKLANEGIAVRDGHMYSPRLMKRLGLSPESGIVRASLVHYNTHREIEKFVRALAEIARG